MKTQIQTRIGLAAGGMEDGKGGSLGGMERTTPRLFPFTQSSTLPIFQSSPQPPHTRALRGAGAAGGAAGYQMPITFGGYTNRSEALTNFPVLVVFSNGVGTSGFSFSNHPFATTTGYDLRFYTNAADTGDGLDYEIESWNTNTAAYVWVRVPLIPTNGSGSILAKWGDAANSTQLPCTTNGAVWDANFRGVWHFTNGVSLSAIDSTANTNHGTIVNASATTGVIDGGASFVRTSSTKITTPSISLGTVHTASAWMKPNTQTGSFNFGGFINGGGNVGPLYVGDATDTLFGYTEGAGAVQATVSSMTASWHHLVTVRNGLAVVCYLDGVQVGSGNLPANTSAGVISIGERNSSYEK